MTNLIVTDATFEKGGRRIVDQANFSLGANELIALMGANGAGKTSLIRLALGLEKLNTGKVCFNGQPISRISVKEKARKIAYLPQQRSLAWPLSVRDVVSLGLYGREVGRFDESLQGAVEEAIYKCSLEKLADRKTNSLSGGELARVHCARMLAAGTPLMIADEPTLSLDPYHQFQIMSIFSEYVSLGGGVLVVLHDIQTAARYSSRLIWMKEGRIVGDGSISETLNENMIEQVYGVGAQIKGDKVILTDNVKD